MFLHPGQMAGNLFVHLFPKDLYLTLSGFLTAVPVDPMQANPGDSLLNHESLSCYIDETELVTVLTTENPRIDTVRTSRIILQEAR
jgi:hypothetical protein